MATLTERDLLLFRTLGKYGLLSTSQVEKIIFPGVQNSTVLRRLRLLERAHWLYRVKALENGALVWVLTRKGEEQAGIEDGMIRPNRNGIEHDVLLTTTRMHLESVGLGENFLPEWILRRKTYRRERGEQRQNIVPDGIFTAVAWNGNVIVIALELEVNPKSITRYEKIFAKYMDQRKLGMIWYFVNTESFGRALFSKWREVARKKYEPHGSLRFTVLSELETNLRKAKIHFMEGGTNTIEQFFKLPLPAHTPAQQVGTLSEKEKVISEGKSANQIENLTPTAPSPRGKPSTADPSPPTML